MQTRCKTKGLKVLTIAIVIALVGGCASGPSPKERAQQRVQIEQARELVEQARQKAEEKRLSSHIEALPEWVIEPPDADSNGLYGVGTARSGSVSAAIEKARLKADFELAQQLRQQLSGLSKSYTSEGTSATVDQQFEQAVERLVSAVKISGQELVEQDLRVVDGRFSAAVLMKLSFDRMESILAKKGNPSGGNSMRNAFQELQVRVEKAEKYEGTRSEAVDHGSHAGTSD